MLKRILSIAALAVVTTVSANAAAVETLKPITQRASLVAMSAVNPMTNEVVEFPADILPDVWMYSSGYQIYLAASGPFPPADSEVEFGNKVEVNAAVNGGGFAWVKTIPAGQETSHDRWWFDTSAPSRFDVNREIGGILVAGVHSFRVKIPYKVGGQDIVLIYDFDYEVGALVFWTTPCLSSDGRVGLDLFIKTLFPVVLGETQVDFYVQDWSNGYGTLGTSVYSTDEWPLYASVPLASVEEYDDLLAYTTREISLSIFGADARVLQEFSPSRFLPVCETGGGKGKQ